MNSTGIFIGIDPGENTGFAVWDSSEHRLIKVETLEIWEAMEAVVRWADECREVNRPILVRFEDARQRKWFQKETSASEYRGKLMGAGAAKRDSRIWEEFLQGKGIPFQAVKPQPGHTKWNPDYWSLVTGWKGRTSEHSRDAALLVFGKYEKI
jgi:hypothetical protein